MSKPLLFIPGPVTCADTVLAAMAQPMIDHRGPAFKALLERVSAGMQPIFGTASADVLILGGSGTGGLEAAVGSLFAAGERVLSCPIGVFGQRLRDIALAFGLQVDVLDTPWGNAVDPAALRARLDAAHYDGVLVTHNETSTGSQNDMAALADVLRGRELRVVVDSVSGLGAAPFEMDAYGFDVVVTASQKALAVPPGLAMVAVAKSAWANMPSGTHGGSFYFDLRKARDFAALGQTPWTPPVSILFALDVALNEYHAAGKVAVFERHDRYARAIRAAVQALGLTLYSQPGAHSVTVVAINAPAGVDADAIRKTLRESRGVVMGGGQKELKGKLLRIGTMGDLSQTDVVGMLGALEVALVEHGYDAKMGAGVQAALRVFIDEAAPAAV